MLFYYVLLHRVKYASQFDSKQKHGERDLIKKKKHRERERAREEKKKKKKEQTIPLNGSVTSSLERRDDC